MARTLDQIVIADLGQKQWVILTQQAQIDALNEKASSAIAERDAIAQELEAERAK